MFNVYETEKDVTIKNERKRAPVFEVAKRERGKVYFASLDHKKAERFAELANESRDPAKALKELEAEARKKAKKK